MVLVGRRPILPAPTDSALGGSAEESVTPTDLDTDISRRTDNTSHTIPDDGRPITISTGRHRSTNGKLTKSAQHSQTSLLIEFVDTGKGPNAHSRPSLRVKIHPSASAKPKKRQDGKVALTQTRGDQQPSYSRRLSLGTDSESHLDRDVNHLDSDLVTRNGAPAQVEVLPRDGSELSSFSKDARYIEPTSDISDMPPDSMLEGNVPITVAPAPIEERSRSLSREENIENDGLKAPVRSRSRSLSHERLTEKVIEKLRNKPREVSSGSGKRRHTEKSSSRSGSKEILEAEATAPRRKSRSNKHREDESVATGNGSSLASNSLLSANRKSGDQYSFRSGTSKSSITNPKLLETVEDAIRRLILPELKELKKDQKVASYRRKFERDADTSNISGSSVSREETTREISKPGREHGSTSRSAASRSGKDYDESLSRPHKRHDRHRKADDLDSASERSYRRRESGDSQSRDDEKGHRRRHKSHRLRDATAGALVGGVLTAAALKHHDSKSSVEHGEPTKRRGKSRSRSASIADSEEIFEKHEVPPMPMRSEVDSELTRSSLLSEQTADTATPVHREVREVIRGSPRETQSPANRTPTRTPVDIRRGLGTHHGNFSNHDLGLHRGEIESSPEHGHDSHLAEGALVGAAGGAAVLASERFMNDDERVRAYEKNLHHQHPIRRGLSPIQSEASYATTEPNRNSMKHTRSGDPLSSVNEEHPVRDDRSINTLSSAQSAEFDKPNRPQGISLENRSEIMGQHQSPRAAGSRGLNEDDFYDEQHEENDRYRDSFASSDPKIDVRRMTNYTDDSLDAPYLDKVTAGQQVARGYGANPEYVHTPPGVESAVASLYDPSLVDVHGSQSPRRSYEDSPDHRGFGTPRSMERDLHVGDSNSPLKPQHVPAAFNEQIYHSRNGVTSPPQSAAHSYEEYDGEEREPAKSPLVEKSLSEKGPVAESPESEITTNPSVIQGPIGGVQRGNLDHWPYGETPPLPKGDPNSHLNARGQFDPVEAALGAGALGAGRGAVAANKAMSPKYEDDLPNRDSYMSGQPVPTPPGYKDEGYVTGDNHRSPGCESPSRNGRDLNPAPVSTNAREAAVDEEDPFSVKHNRHLSGLSHGMKSPLYDSSTGQGLDRIQSKDILALMDHLTVRDAQRNARDTEILFTLVRSAAEMRNSFEDMKRFIQEQDDFIMDEAEMQHKKTQEVIRGPRPQPLGSSRFPQRLTSNEEEDTPTKRKNVFKRAIHGLSSKNTEELQHIEAMVMQLLDKVEALHAAQPRDVITHGPQPRSLNSVENVRPPTDTGYEPEGQAGTSSTGDRSDFFSNNSSRQADHWGSGRRESGNRVSTVMEGDEDFEQPETYQHNVSSPLPAPGPPHLSPSREVDTSRDIAQAGGAAFTTPPRPTQPDKSTSSIKNTPRSSLSDKTNRRNKSLSSSFFPKFSRWSKTTASTIGDNFRRDSATTTHTARPRPYSEASASGEAVDAYTTHDPYGDDRLRSASSLVDDQSHPHGQQFQDDENRPPSPLIPSQVSDNPKYQAHRNSLNLQHPQPRQGPTGRYQHHLETEAQHYGGNDPFSPTSQTSSQWEDQPGSRAPVDPSYSGVNRYVPGGHLSPISDNGSLRTTSSTSSGGRAGPPRPPKIMNDDPLVPQRPPKIVMSPSVSRPGTYVDHVHAARAGSPAFDKSPVAALRSSPAEARKPSGPRPIISSGQYGGAKNTGASGYDNVKRTRFRGSPDQIPDLSGEEDY